MKIFTRIAIGSMPLIVIIVGVWGLLMTANGVFLAKILSNMMGGAALLVGTYLIGDTILEEIRYARSRRDS